jgi:hypothetical protein
VSDALVALKQVLFFGNMWHSSMLNGHSLLELINGYLVCDGTGIVFY